MSNCLKKNILKKNDLVFELVSPTKTPLKPFGKAVKERYIGNKRYGSNKYPIKEYYVFFGACDHNSDKLLLYRTKLHTIAEKLGVKPRVYLNAHY